MHTPISVLLKHKATGGVYSVSPDMTIQSCIDLMNKKKVGAVPVLKGDELVGMFSERDVMMRVASHEKDVRDKSVSTVMTKEVLTIEPSTTVQEAMETITNRRFRHLPVVENNKLIGLVSAGDLTLWVVESQANQIEDLQSYINS